MSNTVQDFSFTDSGNEFVCTVEQPRAAGRPGWWWFSVATDTRGQRYAPFQAADTDTEENVKQRIIEYYERMLVVRATPATSPWQQRRAQRPAAAAVAPAEDAPADADADAATATDAPADEA